jgi:hypothetical protein
MVCNVHFGRVVAALGHDAALEFVVGAATGHQGASGGGRICLRLSFHFLRSLCRCCYRRVLAHLGVAGAAKNMMENDYGRPSYLSSTPETNRLPCSL